MPIDLLFATLDRNLAYTVVHVLRPSMLAIELGQGMASLMALLGVKRNWPLNKVPAIRNKIQTKMADMTQHVFIMYIVSYHNLVNQPQLNLCALVLINSLIYRVIKHYHTTYLHH